MDEFGSDRMYLESMGDVMTEEETRVSVINYIDSLNVKDFITPAFK